MNDQSQNKPQDRVKELEELIGAIESDHAEQISNIEKERNEARKQLRGQVCKVESLSERLAEAEGGASAVLKNFVTKSKHDTVCSNAEAMAKVLIEAKENLEVICNGEADVEEAKFIAKSITENINKLS